jgi:hypothetical protein
MRHARGQKLQSFRRKWPFYMDLYSMDVTLDEARERTSVSWMKIPCSGHVDFPQICGKASDWTVLYLNNI